MKKLTYRGIKYQSYQTSQIEPLDRLSQRQRLNLFTWRGISYSKNIDRVGSNEGD